MNILFELQKGRNILSQTTNYEVVLIASRRIQNITHNPLYSL